MLSERRTVDDESWASQAEDHALPGVVLIFTGGTPVLRAIPVRDRLVLGRDDCGGAPLADHRVSRAHVELRHDGEQWIVRDLHSRNGTFLDGEELFREVAGKDARVLRIGHSVFILCPDVRPYLGGQVEHGEHLVVGPGLRTAMARIAGAARTGDTLLVTGESGSGKELAAAAFHEAGPRAGGPFVAVNCAAIPEGVAERLLFGARRGAYSGAAADAEGYVQAAHGGTLFLDEIGELDLGVQAKLLRVLEKREVMALGAVAARKVELSICSATHRDLREAVAQGRFRADLYFRIGQSEVCLPPLRERLEELPHLIGRQLARLDTRLIAHARLVEACALRPWPGNVRELLGEMRRAGGEALRAGTQVVRVEHLADRAGVELAGAPPSSVDPTPTPPAPTFDRDDLTEAEERERIVGVLARCQGNQSRAAEVLGISRSGLIAKIRKFGLPRPRKRGP